jgi:hypothetical protein
MDKGYDFGPIYDGCEARDCHPIIPLRETPAVKQGKHNPPTRSRTVRTAAMAPTTAKAVLMRRNQCLGRDSARLTSRSWTHAQRFASRFAGAS